MKTLAGVAVALAALVAAPVQSQAARLYHIPTLYHVGFWVRDIAKSRAFYHDYLGFDEPYDLHRASGVLQMAVMKVNERQVIYLFPDASKIKPDGDNLDHLGLLTDSVAGLREHLVDNGFKVGRAARGHIGDLILSITDPDGHKFEVTQLTVDGQLMKHQGMGLPSTRISDRLLCATLAVADLGRSLRFYRDLLGFKVLHPRGTDGSVRVQVPDGTDYLILKPVRVQPGEPPPRAVPQYTLAVPDVSQAAATLAARAATTGFAPPSAPTESPFGQKEISCVDPDGTRVVLAQPAQAALAQ